MAKGVELNWLLIGLILAGELIFAIGLAVVVRLISRYRYPGQTYWMVVVGVAGVVVIAAPLIGGLNLAILAACFTIAGLPMGVEYFAREFAEHHQAQIAREDAIK